MDWCYLLLLITSWCRMDFLKMCKWQNMTRNIVFMFPEEVFHGLKALTGYIHSVGTTRGLHSQSQTLVTRASRNTKSLQFPIPHLTTQRSLKSMGKVWITSLFCLTVYPMPLVTTILGGTDCTAIFLLWWEWGCSIHLFFTWCHSIVYP